MDSWRTSLRAALGAGWAAFLVVACIFGVGCTGGGKMWPETGVPYPFAPTSVRIHPLTHLDRTDDGEHVLVCHIELLDPWGESVRGVGQLKVSLFGPARPVSTEDALWRFDLNNLKTNRTLYDPATRTYRLQLIELPAWVVEMGSGTGSAASGSIVAELTMVGVDGQTIVVRGRETLRR